MSFWVVYTEGLRALLRGRMAPFGVAALLLLVGLLAAFAGTDVYGLEFFLVLTYIVVPSGLSALAALLIAGPRASKFVQAVFTAPVGRAAYFWAHAAIAATVGLAYLAFTLPFAVIHQVHIGLPHQYALYLGAGVLMVAYGTGLGLLLGVMFPGRSVAPSATLSVLPLLLLLCIPLVYIAFYDGFNFESKAPKLTNTGRVLFHMAHLSPQVSIMDGLGIWEGADEGLEHLHPWRMLAASIGATIGMLGLAAFTFLRLQGVEGWEAKPYAQTIVAVLLLVLLVGPALSPDADAYKPPPTGSDAYVFAFASQGRLVAFVTDRGAPPTQEAMYRQYDQGRAFPIGQANDVDLLLGFMVERGYNVTSYDLTIRGMDGVRVVGERRFAQPAWTATESWEEEYSGFGELSDQALRIPLTFIVERAEGLTNGQFHLNVTGSFTIFGADPEADPPMEPTNTTAQLTDLAAFTASVPGAAAQTGAAMAVAPLAFLVIGTVRGVRRR